MPLVDDIQRWECWAFFTDHIGVFLYFILKFKVKFEVLFDVWELQRSHIDRKQRENPLGMSLTILTVKQIKGHLFVTSSSLHISCDLLTWVLRWEEYTECIFSVVGDNSVVFNQNVICPHTFSTVQCLAEIYMGCVSASGLLSQSSGSLKKADMFYVSGIWWQGLFITWWICQTDPCSNLCLSPSFSKTMCDISQ